MTARSIFAPRCKVQLEVVMDGRGAPNSKPFHIEVDPRSASVGLNGYYEADTFNIEIDARVLPFDPDQVAYCAARVYMWDALKYPDREEWAIDDNLMIKGLVDDIETSIIGEDNMLTFIGRDYTAILVDPEWDPKQKVKTNGGTLLDVVQSIADEAAPEDSQARFEVVWRGEKPPPKCGTLGRSTKKKGMWFKAGKTYWDIIWDLCIQHAYVPRIQGAQIIIEEPATQTRQSLAEGPRLIYGQTLTKIEVKRKFSREKVPQIVITAWDPVTGKKIEVKYPKKRNIDVQASADPKARDALGIRLTVKKDEVMYFPAPKGITDPDALERYARMRFYHIGRGESIYSFGTSHLWIPDAFEVDEVNMLQLRPGNAIGIQFDPFNQEHLRALDVGQRVEHIIALGYRSEVADFVANNLDRMDMFKQDYYYNRGDIQYSIDDGIEIEIEATNFAGAVREIQFAEASA